MRAMVSIQNINISSIIKIFLNPDLLRDCSSNYSPAAYPFVWEEWRNVKRLTYELTKVTKIISLFQNANFWGTFKQLIYWALVALLLRPVRTDSTAPAHNIDNILAL